MNVYEWILAVSAVVALIVGVVVAISDEDGVTGLFSGGAVMAVGLMVMAGVFGVTQAVGS